MDNRKSDTSIIPKKLLITVYSTSTQGDKRQNETTGIFSYEDKLVENAIAQSYAVLYDKVYENVLD